ncbi:helix-turn-helix transcriptional regulator [Streptomyces sp. JJ38]|uniref:helix-turn-helix domain-containing protein n=1 Tax=Streptomyces sp. JJ38 TaxID=2738128 RepID=UPI001C5779B3|nr:helix-turn-helix domain-containing protein [Streptomyces sp. JJ38]
MPQRRALGHTLGDAARTAGVSISAISRWERVESPLASHALEPLCRFYGVDTQETRYLLRNLPPQRSQRTVGINDFGVLAHRGRWDRRADVADEGVKRHVAVSGAASEVVHDSLLSAIDHAPGPQDSYDLIKRAAGHWPRKAAT